MTGNDHFGSNSSSLVYPIGSMYGIYANIWGILIVNVTIYIAYMDPMGMFIGKCIGL